MVVCDAGAAVVTRLYYIDSPTAEEAASRYPKVEPGFFTLVIRRVGRPGWIFRFTSIDGRGARETCANLNWGRAAV